MTSSSGDAVVDSVVSTVGLWWPDAEEGDLRAAAKAWQDFARAIDDAHADGRGGAAQARAHWAGEASEAFGTHWKQFDEAMPMTAEGARSLASALEEFADEVEKAKHQVYELAIEIGASVAIGAALAFFTFGTSAAAASGTIMALRAAAMRIAVQLTARVGTIAARSIIGASFGAVSSFGGNLVGQVARVEGFGDGGYSAEELAKATAVGGGTGGLLGGAGGVVSKLRAPRIAPDRHGLVTDGNYRVGPGQSKHVAGTAPAGKSTFFRGTDADKLALDAARRADKQGLWGKDGKAKVDFGRPVGTHDRTGNPTTIVNVYRRKGGTIHISPGSPK